MTETNSERLPMVRLSRPVRRLVVLHRFTLIALVALLLATSIAMADDVAASGGGTIDEAQPLLPVRDWPMFGGTTYRNHVSSATNLPTEWDTERRENVRWSANVGSVAMGGVVVSGDRVFVGTNNEAEWVKRFPRDFDLGCLICFDRQTGKFLWQHSTTKLPTGRVHDWPFQGIVSTPCIEGERLWYVTNRAEVVCLDVAGFSDGENDGPFVDEEVAAEPEGDVVWKLDLMGELGVSPHNLSTCSPVTDGKRLFIITGNGTDETHVTPPPKAPDVLCLDRATGKILWQDRPAGERTLHGSWSSPTYGVINGQPMVLMGCGDGWVYAYDPQGDGNGGPKLLWKFDCNPKAALWKIGGYSGARRNCYVAIPVIHNNRVYLRTGQDPEHGDGVADLWCIDPVKHLDGSDVSETQVFANVVAGKPVGAPLPPRRNQNLDTAAGEAELPNPKSAVVWHSQSEDLNVGGGPCPHINRGLGSPTIKDDLLFITDTSGYLFCVDANTGKPHWRHDLFAACYSTPLIADGKVHVTDDDGELTIFALSKEFKLIAELQQSNSTVCTPIACEETLYMLARNRLHAIAFPKAASQTNKAETDDRR
ncbi:MAG: PQQ-binding-like beta-propeller repeat protein [Planctomycetaceae bacterium]